MKIFRFLTLLVVRFFFNDNVTKRHYMDGIVEFGRITSVDTTKYQCTVTFPDRNYQSGPMQWAIHSAVGTQELNMPSKGDTAIVLHTGNSRERGIIIGTLYTIGNPPPSSLSGQNGSWRGTLYGDGSYIVYDQTNSNYILNLQGKVTLTTVGDLNATVGGKLVANVTSSVSVISQSTVLLQGTSLTLQGPTTINGVMTFNGQINHTGGMNTSGIHTDSNGVHV